MKRNKLYSLAIITLVLIFFAYYFIHNKSNFSELLELNPWYLIPIVVGYVGMIFLNGVFVKIIIVPFSKSISYKDSLEVSVLTSIGNYFGPLLGGASIKAVYLKKKVNLSYTDFISSTYGYYVIAFLVSTLVGIISLVLLKGYSSDPRYFLTLIFFVVTFIFLSSIAFKKEHKIADLFINKISTKRFSQLKNINESWKKIVAHPNLVKSLIAMTLLNIFLFVMIAYFEFLAIGVHLSVGSVLLYSTLGIFITLISLTPGALGIREAIFLFLSSVMGITNSQIISVAIIDRTTQFIVMFCIWALVSVFLKVKI